MSVGDSTCTLPRVVALPDLPHTSLHTRLCRYEYTRHQLFCRVNVVLITQF
jgi:hypothetical protein